MPPILFYFDFSSPYGYLASLRIDEIAGRHQRDVEWKPILLGPIFKTSGSSPLTSQPLKGRYALHDFVRSARWNAAPFHMPNAFPIATHQAARAYYWLHDTDPDKAKRLAKRLFEAYFTNGKDISSAEAVIAEARSLDAKAESLGAALTDPAIKERLKAEVENAISLGVCGSPYIIVDGEPFWGADRLDQVEAWIRTGGW
jgi:2-hydroxychromene-2-carboxylate isomerase